VGHLAGDLGSARPGTKCEASRALWGWFARERPRVRQAGKKLPRAISDSPTTLATPAPMLAALARATHVVDLVKGNVAGVGNVLLLLAVTGGLLERLDDERRGRGDDRNRSLTVLDRELDGHAETLPVTGRLGDVLSDLLGRLTVSAVPRGWVAGIPARA
jgi:hypothetical protein